MSATTPIASITVHEDGTVDRNAEPHPEVLARHREFLERDRARRRET
jgi:hypothetical protein